MLSRAFGKNIARSFAVAICFALPAKAEVSLNVPAANYKIDPRHTQIVFAIKHLGLSTFYGRFGAVTGALSFDPAKPEKSALTVSVDMTNIQTHVPELDSELSKVFHANKFPAVTFVAGQVVKTGTNTGTVAGNLTLAGVTKPVTLNVTFNGGRNSPLPLQPYRIGFDASGIIHRTDFGLTGMIWSGWVGEDVTLDIECEMEKQ